MMLPLCTSVTLLRLILHRVADRAVHQALGPEPAHGLDADADLDPDVPLGCADRLRAAPARCGRRASLPKRIFLKSFGNSCCEEVEHLLRLGRAGDVLDAGVDVLGVLPEDHHVHFLGMLDRRRHALIPANRPQADVEIEQLTQRDVQRPDAAADRRRQRAFDADEVLRNASTVSSGSQLFDCLKLSRRRSTSSHAIFFLPP